MKRGEYLSICIVLLAWANLAGGATLRVGRGGAYTSIQAAIDAAQDGDAIEVAPGTYTGPGDLTEDSAMIDFKGKGVRLYSARGAAVTTLNGSHYQHAVRCITGEGSDTILDGFTITLGGWGEYPSGGGMYNRGSSPTVANCLFTKNHAYYSGGAMYNEDSSPMVVRCAFVENITYMGGGAVNNFGGSPTMIDCLFRDNSSGYYGGAMYNTNADAVMINCLFHDNGAAYDGAGLYNHNSFPIVVNCTFAGNVIWAPGEYGGGAMYNWDSSPTVVNSVLWGNSGDEITGDPGIVAYSDVEGGRPGEGNIDLDPQFAGVGDYHLKPGSPCIDAGTNDPPGGLPATDIDRWPRKLDGDGDGRAIADMGAFEALGAGATQAVQDLITELGKLSLPSWVRISLRMKLQCALTIVSDANAANDRAAIQTLNSFNREVRSLQGSGKIPQATAAVLNAEAQQIIAMLNFR